MRRITEPCRLLCYHQCNIFFFLRARIGERKCIVICSTSAAITLLSLSLPFCSSKHFQSTHTIILLSLHILFPLLLSLAVETALVKGITLTILRVHPYNVCVYMGVFVCLFTYVCVIPLSLGLLASWQDYIFKSRSLVHPLGLQTALSSSTAASGHIRPMMLSPSNGAEREDQH